MNVVLSENIGFCFGVDRAVTAVLDTINNYQMQIFTYGPIIHNEEVVNDFKNKGVKVLNSIEEIDSIDKGIIIIRSHGVSPDVYEKIKEKKLLSIDMTCPYVLKIHKLIKEHYDKGYEIIIIGNSNHPEIISNNGWCNNSAVIIGDLSECDKLDKINKACIIVQTTFERKTYQEIKDKIVPHCAEYVEFDTICNSTSSRQNEALELSKNADAMIIVGSPNSANAKRLYSICKNNCNNCYLISDVGELDLQEICKFANIALLGAASSPKWMVEEIYKAIIVLDNKVPNADTNFEDETTITPIDANVTNNINQDKTNEDSENYNEFEKELNLSFKKINVGDILKAEVVSKNEDEVIVDIGYITDGLIPATEIIDNLDDIKIGDIFECAVIGIKEECVILSKSKIDLVKAWDEIKVAYQEDNPIWVFVTNDVKGGVIGYYKGIKVFIPLSQLSDRYVEDAKEFVGNTITAKILELDLEKENIVASSKAYIKENYNATQQIVNKEEKQDKVFNFKLGDIIEGKVVKNVSFGSFIEIEPGVEGLVHISQISDKRLNKPDDILVIGQKVLAKVINIDNNKFSLSIKEVSPINEKGSTNTDYFTDDNMDFKNQELNVTIFDAIKQKRK